MSFFLMPEDCYWNAQVLFLPVPLKEKNTVCFFPEHKWLPTLKLSLRSSHQLRQTIIDQLWSPRVLSRGMEKYTRK
jgi:hypothetical protein